MDEKYTPPGSVQRGERVELDLCRVRLLQGSDGERRLRASVRTYRGEFRHMQLDFHDGKLRQGALQMFCEKIDLVLWQAILDAVGEQQVLNLD